MDIAKLLQGTRLVLGGSVAFLIISLIFNWQGVDGFGISMWHGFFGVLAGLVAAALVAWEIARLMNVKIALPLSPAMTTAFLALLLAVLTVLKFLVDGELRTFWAWLGLILAIVIAASAVIAMKEGGESLGDLKENIAAGAAAAAAAAKSAADSARDDATDAVTPDASGAAPPSDAPSDKDQSS
jgi:hypothetical protein